MGSPLKNRLSEITEGPIQEGTFTKRLEQQTAKIPSSGFLGLAIASIFVSAGLALFTQRKDTANFIGLWAPSFLLIGIYNKLVKQLGSDRQEDA